MDKTLRKQIKKLEEEMEALIIAIPKEEASYHFYKDLANQTELEGAKIMFKNLAEEELKHKTKLINQVEQFKSEIDSLKRSNQ
jgi:rubrerythrin